MWIMITLAAAAIGGLLFQRLRIPAGFLLGAVVSVAMVNITTGMAYIWPQTRTLSQILAGAYLGGMMTKQDLRLLPKLIGPYLIITGGFLALNIAVACLLHRITDMSLISCLFSAMPGGISDAPLMAMDMGADVAAVTILQFIRVVFGLVCLPGLISLSDGHAAGNTLKSNKRSRKPEASGAFQAFLPTLCLSAAAGIMGKLTGIAAGTISCSMLAAACLSIAGKGSPMPGWLRKATQLLCGCCIGIRIGMEQLAGLPALIIPAAILCAGYLLLCLAAGCLISRLFRFPLKEAMLFLAPAGGVEMTFIAADMGIESPALALLQMFRVVTVVLLFPQIFYLLVYVL